MKHISVDAFKQVLEAEKNNDSIDFINVCEPAEYNENILRAFAVFHLEPLSHTSASLEANKPSTSIVEAVSAVSKRLRN
jgi:hypothetical protein